jgi:integrase
VLLAAASKVRPVRGDYVFYDPRKPEQPKNIDIAWKKCRVAAGLFRDRDDPLDQVVLHSTRHSAVTKLLRGGANTTQAAVISGHKTLAMLKRYSHLVTDDVADMADRLLSVEKK